MKSEDFKLVREYLKGDLNSFETLLKKYQYPLYNFIYKSLRSQQESEDLYQEIYMKVVKYIDRFKFESSYKTWLFSIARNTIIDRYRKKKLKLLSIDNPIADGGTDFHEVVPSEEDTPSQTLSKKSVKKDIKSLLDSLEEPYKEICVLRFYSEMKFKEIAEVLKMNENSVKTRFRKALNILKESYGL